MTPTEFEFQARIFLGEVHAAMTANDGTIERTRAEGQALVAALQFLDRAYDETGEDEQELRAEIEATGLSLGPCLALNVQRLHAAVQSAAELAAAMSEVIQVTLH